MSIYIYIYIYIYLYIYIGMYIHIYVYAFADKTANIYKLPPQDCKKLLHENITKSSKKSPTRLEKSISLEAKEIAAGIKIDNRIEYMARAPVYITLKDHKDNFRSAHPCRLINSCKSEIGKISKSILEKRNRNLVKLLQVNQWRNSESVIKCFILLKTNHSVNLSSWILKNFIHLYQKKY